MTTSPEASTATIIINTGDAADYLKRMDIDIADVRQAIEVLRSPRATRPRIIL
ncbi:hypothetical protein [Mycolicibacter algericus]|uniref:hypothetical protein n=1 Tax=Mycolicibacter algericus TaxID=1288388 RepID=UPI0013D2AB45|nr:hypothetical protein [Mycolicibacter algericus]